jgi:hypothetical protein
MYGVSAKTVRDIWVGRTWYWATYPLDLTRSISTERLERKLGRPKGKKDSRPRSRKLCPTSEEMEKSAAAPWKSFSIKKDQKCVANRSIVGRSIFSDVRGVTLSSADISNPSIASPPANIIPPSAQAWHEALLCAATSTDFVDPFHNDWLF